MKEAFERPIAESNNGQKRNELEFHTLKFWFLYAYCIIILGISMKITTAVCVLDFRIPRTQWYLLLMSTTYHTRYTDVRLVFTGYFLYIAANEYSAISLRRALSD